MPDKKAMMFAAGGYLKHHPEELARAIKNAAALRFGLPLDALRWLAAQVRGKRAPRDVELQAVPPGIRASAVVNLAGTEVRAAASVYVETVVFDAEQLRMELRVRDIQLDLLDLEAESPVATLLKSGVLDLSKPGNIAAALPKRPAILVDASDDRVVLDLRKHPKLANGRAEKLLNVLMPIVTIRAIETDERHLDILMKAFPGGVADAVQALRDVM